MTRMLMSCRDRALSRLRVRSVFQTILIAAQHFSGSYVNVRSRIQGLLQLGNIALVNRKEHINIRILNSEMLERPELVHNCRDLFRKLHETMTMFGAIPCLTAIGGGLKPVE